MIAEKLKKSILQEAIQGRLVQQNPDDEPASVLLNKIREEKRELVKAGKIRADKQESFIFRGADNIKGTTLGRFYERIGKGEPIDITEELPFAIPESWEWVRLSEIVEKPIKRGRSPKYADYSKIRVFAQKCNLKNDTIDLTLAKFLDETVLKNYSAQDYIYDKDIIINSTGEGTLGRVGFFQNKYRIDGTSIVPDSHVTIIRGISKLYKNFLFIIIKSYQNELEKNGSGSTKQTELHPDIISKLFIPVPPIYEQKRIVSALDNLLPKVSEYQKIETKVHQINLSFPDKFIKSILQAAVQGKLVPQNSDDEPASVLLEKIRAEKQELVKAGKIKADKHEAIIFRGSDKIKGTSPGRFYERIDKSELIDITEGLPFAIPETWEWVRLGSILKSLNDGTHTTPKYVSQGIPFLSVKNISSGKIDFTNCKYITEEEHKVLYKRCNPEFGDILLTKVGTTGIPVLVNTKEQFSLFVSVALLKIFSSRLNPYFLIHVINSPLVQYQAKAYTKGVGNQNWVIRDIAKTLISLPPLSEQCRIVNTINKIYKKMDIYSYE